jgi:hypothetical protein
MISGVPLNYPPKKTLRFLALQCTLPHNAGDINTGIGKLLHYQLYNVPLFLFVCCHALGLTNSAAHAHMSSKIHYRLVIFALTNHAKGACRVNGIGA